MITNETITEAPKDCDDSGTIWESGDLKFPVLYICAYVCVLAYGFNSIFFFLNKLERLYD